MFGILKKQAKPVPLDADKAMSERAERGGSPSRIVNSFADFAGPDQTVQAVELDEYLPLLKGGIDALRHETGFDTGTFEKLVMPMLRRYLSWVHLLPASASHHHARLGGLAIHGLDVATMAARNAHNAVLDFDPAYTRDLELRANRRSLWPLAAATAGLHHDLGKILIDQIVTCADTGEVWNPFVSDMLSWSKKQNVKRYAVRWRGNDRLHRHESFGLFLMGTIAGQEVLGSLAGLGRDVIEAVLMSVSGERDDPSGMRQMVHQADVASSKLDRDSGQAYWSESNATADPVLGRLLDVAATLVRKRVWKVNTPGHHLWVTSSGAYLIWPQAFTALRQELVNNQNSVGIPNDPTEIAEMFLRARIAMPRELSNGQRVPLWSLHLPAGDKPEVDETSPFAVMMAKLGGHRNALYIPDPGSLIAGLVIPDASGLRVARDPTLPETIIPAQESSVQESDPVDNNEAVSTSDSESPLPVETPLESPGSDLPLSQTEQQDRSITSISDAGRASRVEPAQAAKERANPSLQLPLAENTPVETIAGDAMQILNAAGPFGVVLGRIADRIALERENYPSRDRLQMKGTTLLIRWPDAVREEVADVRALAEAIAANPEMLGTINGQAIDVAGAGITSCVRVRGQSWNAVPLNKTLSEAFNKVARRFAKPESTDIPA